MMNVRYRRQIRSVSRPQKEQGISLLELLFAMVMLSGISISILPVFVRATQNNLAGLDSSKITGHAGVEVESVRPMPFNAAELTLLPSTTEASAQEWWLPADPTAGSGSPGFTAPKMTNSGLSSGVWTEEFNSQVVETTPWTRTTTLRQYGLADLYDNKQLDNPLDGNTPQAYVQLKEVTMLVQSSRGTGQAGGGRHITLRYLKAF